MWRPAVYTDVREMVRQSDVDVVYILAPNCRVSVVEAILKKSSGPQSTGHCPGEALTRNVQEAKRIIELIEGQGLLQLLGKRSLCLWPG